MDALQMNSALLVMTKPLQMPITALFIVLSSSVVYLTFYTSL